MNEHDATEQAYNNGYKQGIKDIVGKLKVIVNEHLDYEFDVRCDAELICNDIDNLLKEMVGE